MLHAMLTALQENGPCYGCRSGEELPKLARGRCGHRPHGVGAGLGIGKIGAAAAEGIARQPEAAASIQGAAIIMAALIEGVALFGLVITILYKLLA